MDRKNIAEVIPLNMHLDRGFHYLIPHNLEKSADIGKRVKISFRNKKRLGVIIRIFGETDVKSLKEIEEIIDPFPVLSPDVLAITDWISKYYLCPKGTILNHIIPSQVSMKKITSFLDGYPDNHKFPITINMSIGNKEHLYQKNNQGFLRFDSYIDKHNDNAHKTILFHYHNYEVRDRYYSKWIKNMLERGKQVLILIPDQWCCVELKQKLTKKYGSILGIFDKKVNQTQKYLRYLRVERDDIKVVIGNRSSIFLPFWNLGLIIVEQEDSLLYKEERIPRYHAREVALARGEIGKFQVILGSFTPAIESYWQSVNQEYILKTEKSLIRYHLNFPEIQVVNMEEEKSFQHLISFRLQQQIVRSLNENKKIILFLNRRGFASYMVCSQCGYVLKCPECGHLLSYHIEDNAEWTVCHTCGKRIRMEKYCPNCKKGEIKPLGTGTQYVETFIRRMFPKKKIQRLDIDIAPKISTQKKIMNEFNRGKIDIFIGTQLIFRELDYQHVGLIGFILADYLLNIQDYRSAELSFQCFYQLALNLAEKNKSKVLFIQTYQPQHHSIQAIKELDYPLFYREEMINRDELKYPPFARMMKIDFIGREQESVRKSAIDFIEYTRQSGLASKYELEFQLSKDNIMIVQEKDQNKVSFTLRIDTKKQMISYLKETLFQYILKYKLNGVKLVIDVDPMKMW